MVDVSLRHLEIVLRPRLAGDVREIATLTVSTISPTLRIDEVKSKFQSARSAVRSELGASETGLVCQKVNTSELSQYLAEEVSSHLLGSDFSGGSL